MGQAPGTQPDAAEAKSFEDLTRHLKVALVHDWLNGMRGGEKVLEAIAACFPGAPIYTLFAVEEALSEALRRHPIKTSMLQAQLPRRLLLRHYRYLLPFFPRAIEEFDLTGYDLVISTSHCVAKGVLPAPDGLHLCYCHSPMRYAWDLERHYFPSRRGPIAAIRGQLLSGLRQWDVASCPRVDHFWANSSWVASRIHRYYGRRAEVLPPPVAVDTFESPISGQRPHDEPDALDGPTPDAVTAYEEPAPPFALAVSALVPYKKLNLAIQACEQRKMPLKVVGTGPEYRTLKRLCGGHTELLGRVDDETLQALYRDAQLFLQPGVEDFGIATVEALASGTPVVAVGRGGVLDIVRDGADGVLYDGFTPEDVNRAIDKFLKIRFNALKLKKRAQSFSNAQFAQRLKTSIAHRLVTRGPCRTDTERR